jgi:hypothetical protein
VFLFGGGAVSWKSCKQTILTKSTMEAELAALDTAGAEAEWRRDFLLDLPCHTRISGHQDPGANIITRCAGTKSHTYDELWHRIECHIFTI